MNKKQNKNIFLDYSPKLWYNLDAYRVKKDIQIQKWFSDIWNRRSLSFKNMYIFTKIKSV
jgi:hypothetical protein